MLARNARWSARLWEARLTQGRYSLATLGFLFDIGVRIAYTRSFVRDCFAL